MTTTTNKRTRGQILKIKTWNFMTYEKFSLEPDAGLNLIVGPNGSGKSSIMSAICLGFGGKPELTGRHIKTEEFIKHGHSSAKIEIELYESPTKKVVIERIIDKHANKNSFRINGQRCNRDMVVKKVKDLNIQLDNLCQFMPQENVALFSKMDSKQFLKCMLQTVGDQNMFSMHDHLKELRANSIDTERRVQHIDGELEKEREKNSRLEHHIEAFDQRQRILDKREKFQKLKPVAVYMDEHGKYIQCKKVRDKRKEKLRDFKKKSIEPLDEKKIGFAKKLSEMTKDQASVRAILEDNEKKARNIKNDIARLSEEICTLKSKFQADIDAQRTQQADLKEIEEQIVAFKDNLEKNVEKLENEKPFQEERENDVKKYQQSIRNVEAELDEIKLTLEQTNHEKLDIQNVLEKLNDVEANKMKFLRQRDSDTFKAVMWLKENQNMFRQTVHNPVFTVLEVPNKDNCRYVENHIAVRDLLTFVCEDREDVKTLTNILRSQMNLRVNIALAPNKPLSSFQPRYDLNELKQRYGVRCFLKDVFKAPDPVMAFLCDTYNVQNTPIGSENSESLILNQMNQRDAVIFSRFFTPTSVISMRRSHYGARLVNSSSTQLRPNGFLSSSSSDVSQIAIHEQKLEEIEQHQGDLEQRKNAIQRKMNLLKEEQENLKRKKKEYSVLMKDINDKKALVKFKENQCENMKKNKIDLNQRKAETDVAIGQCNKKKIAVLAKLLQIVQWGNSKLRKCINVDLYHSLYKKAVFLLEEEINDLKQQQQNIVKEYTEANSLYEKQKKKVSVLLAQTNKDLGYNISTAENKTRIQNEVCDVFGDESANFSLQFVEEEITRLTAELTFFGNTDRGIIDEYHKRRKNIEELEKKLLEDNLKLDSVRQDMEVKKQQWLVPLKEIIEKISNTFSKYFKRLNYVGEIILNQTDNPDDFENYGLGIMVKYRDKTPLMHLSQAHHSGGECSVATIVFILSLQELIDVPFRCVDEINQGMDAINERNMFDLVAESAEKSSQYFLLTPKLLERLKYSRRIKTHAINSGNTSTMNSKKITVQNVLRHHQVLVENASPDA